MTQAYINLRRFKGRIHLDYLMSIDIRNNQKTIGVYSSYEGIEEVKDKLLELLKNTHENKIIIKSMKYMPKSRGYSRVGIKKLEEIRDFLSNKKKDIKFKLTT